MAREMLLSTNIHMAASTDPENYATGMVGSDLGKNKLVNNNCNIIAPIIYCYLLQIIDKYWSDLEVLQ